MIQAGRLRASLIWAGLAAALVVPVGVAANSPLLAWRDTVYAAAGFAGIVALGLLLVQPLLATGALPGLSIKRGRVVHAWVGGGIVAAVVAHVGALWVTSEPDVIDALLFQSPTEFSGWGVVAMWAVFGAAVWAALRGRLGLRLILWRLVHVSLALVVVVGSVVHAMLIDGTMETVSKAVLCGLVLAAAGKLVVDLRLLFDLRRVVAGRSRERAGAGGRLQG